MCPERLLSRITNASSTISRNILIPFIWTPRQRPNGNVCSRRSKWWIIYSVCWIVAATNQYMLLFANHLRCEEQHVLICCSNKSVHVALRNGDGLREPAQRVRELVQLLQHKETLDEQQVSTLVAEVTQLEQTIRESTMQRIAQGHLDLKQGVSLMDIARWLQHVAVHIENIDLARRRLNYQAPAEP